MSSSYRSNNILLKPTYVVSYIIPSIDCNLICDITLRLCVCLMNFTRSLSLFLFTLIQFALVTDHLIIGETPARGHGTDRERMSQATMAPIVTLTPGTSPYNVSNTWVRLLLVTRTKKDAGKAPQSGCMLVSNGHYTPLFNSRSAVLKVVTYSTLE